MAQSAPQEHQSDILPIETLPDNMLLEIFKHLSSRDQLSLTQTNKNLR
ncbi:MAG: F-box protein [Alphaproteobacteria bacterium]